MQLQSEKMKVADYFKAGNLDLGMIRTEAVCCQHHYVRDCVQLMLLLECAVP
jgi:hypothetical protein